MQRLAILFVYMLLAVSSSIICMEEDICRWAKLRPGLELILSDFSPEERAGEASALYHGTRHLITMQQGAAVSAKNRELIGSRLQLLGLSDRNWSTVLSTNLRVVEAVLHRQNGQNYKESEDKILEAFGMAYEGGGDVKEKDAMMAGDLIAMLRIMMHTAYRRTHIQEGIRRWWAGS